ncbi:flavodoxin [Companilactobacillus paralimentarius]|uniref:flavodoxin n=1 Tax=Companilactobacillus paralimentarius TaxID=83526 RepID=UPI00385103FF
MKRARRVKLIGIIIAIIIVLGVIIGVIHSRSNTRTSDDNAIQETKGTNKISGKTLIIYFSHAGRNYEGNLKTGNTAVIANYIKDKTHADVYEVIPAKAYPTDSYSKLTKIATNEKDNNDRPAIKGQLPNVDKYKNIFIGSPIWYSEYPMVMRTLFDKINLNNKTVIPFVTNEGSGFGSTREILKRKYPKAKMLKGYETEGSNVKDDQSSVNKWLDSLGY